MFMTVDPGARSGGGTGIALFQSDPEKKHPIAYHHLKPDRKLKEHTEKTNDVVNQLQELIANLWWSPLSSPVVYIERPSFFDSHVGHTAARTDSLFKLCFIYGRLYEVFYHHKLEIIEVPVREWKGQLSKQQVLSRIKRAIGEIDAPSDVLDAIGLGLHIKGVLSCT